MQSKDPPLPLRKVQGMGIRRGLSRLLWLIRCTLEWITLSTLKTWYDTTDWTHPYKLRQHPQSDHSCYSPTWKYKLSHVKSPQYTLNTKVSAGKSFTLLGFPGNFYFSYILHYIKISKIIILLRYERLKMKLPISLANIVFHLEILYQQETLNLANDSYSTDWIHDWLLVAS